MRYAPFSVLCTLHAYYNFSSQLWSIIVTSGSWWFVGSASSTPFRKLNSSYICDVWDESHCQASASNPQDCYMSKLDLPSSSIQFSFLDKGMFLFFNTLAKFWLPGIQITILSFLDSKKSRMRATILRKRWPSDWIFVVVVSNIDLE